MENSQPTRRGPQGPQPGLFVAGTCATVQASAGGAVSVQTCYATDGNEQGHLGTIGIGAGTPGAGATAGLMVATAPDVHDLAGPFGYVSCGLVRSPTSAARKMTANDSQDSISQTVWPLGKLATAPSRRQTADGFVDSLRSSLARVLLLMRAVRWRASCLARELTAT